MCVQKFIYPIYIEKRIFSVFTKWHIYTCTSAVFILQWMTIYQKVEKAHVKHAAAHALQPVSNLPLVLLVLTTPSPPLLLLHHHPLPSPSPSPPLLPLLPSPSPSPPPPALPFSLPSMHPGLHGQKLPPYFLQTKKVCLSSSDFENQIKRCPFTCLHITISLFTDMLLGCNSNTACW